MSGLAHFYRLAEEYDAWAASFPTSVTRFDPTSERPLSPHDRAYLSARALVLRKFLVVESEVTHATRVLEALGAALQDGHVTIEALRASFEQIGRAVEVMRQPGRPEPLGQGLKDRLLGIPRHAHRKRRGWVDERSSVSDDLALWTFVLQGESFLRHLCRVIRTAAENGQLASDARAEVLAAA